MNYSLCAKMKCLLCFINSFYTDQPTKQLTLHCIREHQRCFTLVCTSVLYAVFHIISILPGYLDVNQRVCKPLEHEQWAVYSLYVVMQVVLHVINHILRLPCSLPKDSTRQWVSFLQSLYKELLQYYKIDFRHTYPQRLVCGQLYTGWTEYYCKSVLHLLIRT